MSSSPATTLHNTCRHLIVFISFLSLVFCFFSPCTHQTDNIIMSILRTVKTFCASSNKGKEINDKANTLKQCGFRAAMVNILKRIFRQRVGPVMWLQGLGTRRRPCASRLNTHLGAPCLGGRGAGVPAVCWDSGGGHCREDCATCRCGGNYLCLESIHSDAYIHFFAIVDSVKNHPA